MNQVRIIFAADSLSFHLARPLPSASGALLVPAIAGQSLQAESLLLRLVVPEIDCVDASVFARQPMLDWTEQFALLGHRQQWPSIDELEAMREAAVRADGIERPRFSAQSVDLLDDGLHYEERIQQGRIATRERNWHDLLNALVWLRYPSIKRALNTGQCADVARLGRRQRSRAQCAMTHFDEAGAIVLCSDPALLALWDRHDWQALFWRERASWGKRIAATVFGHAILELALQPQRLLVAKCIVLLANDEAVAELSTQAAQARPRIDARISALIAQTTELADPQNLRPLPLSGIPGWHADAGEARFFADAPCFRPLRPGRVYPPPRTL